MSCTTCSTVRLPNFATREEGHGAPSSRDPGGLGGPGGSGRLVEPGALGGPGGPAKLSGPGRSGSA